MSTDNRDDIVDTFLDEGIHVQVLTEAELRSVLGRGLGDVIETLLLGAVPTMRYPKRNSREYQDMLQDGANCEELQATISGIRQVWEGYGFIGWVDFMGVLITSIELHAPDAMRDAFGLVRLDKILRTDHDEAELMETAVKIANDPGAAEKGFDFTGALTAGLEIVATVDTWMPGFQQALRCAHARDTAGMRAALVNLPGIKDEEHLHNNIQAVLVLAMAHMSVTRPVNVLDQWEKHS